MASNIKKIELKAFVIVLYWNNLKYGGKVLNNDCWGYGNF